MLNLSWLPFWCPNVRMWTSPAPRIRGVNLSVTLLSALINSTSWLQWFSLNSWWTFTRQARHNAPLSSTLKASLQHQAELSWNQQTLSTRERGHCPAGGQFILWPPTPVSARTQGRQKRPRGKQRNFALSQKGPKQITPDTSTTRGAQSITWAF